MSVKKVELLKECVKIMQSPKVAFWYEQHLDKKPQVETINELSHAIDCGELTSKEALAICLIVGFQWNEKFEGVP